MKKLVIAFLFALLCSMFLVPVASAHTTQQQAGCVNYPPGWPIDQYDNPCPPQQNGDQGPGIPSTLCSDPSNLLGCNGATTNPPLYCLGGSYCNGVPSGDNPPVVSYPSGHHHHHSGGLLNHLSHHRHPGGLLCDKGFFLGTVIPCDEVAFEVLCNGALIAITRNLEVALKIGATACALGYAIHELNS